jgi:hypothetical protein
MSCFNGNGLDATLRSLAITDVIVAGVGRTWRWNTPYATLLTSDTDPIS